MAGEAAYSLNLMVVETANVIWKKAVRGELVQRYVTRRLEALRLLATDVVILEDEKQYLDEAHSIALSRRVTVYDSLFIAQAKRHGALLTGDKKQAEAARREGVEVYLLGEQGSLD